MFKLTKNYFDAIDPNGNCWIIYFAQLNLGLVHIYYSSVIFSNDLNTTTENSSLQKHPPLKIEDTTFLSNEKLQLRGSWKKRMPAIHANLWKHPTKGSVNWLCHHPVAKVELTYQSRTYQATGYAETIELPFNPLFLPLNHLRWGRYTDDENSLVWIHWEGKYPLNKIFFNGKEFNDAVFDEDGFTFDTNQYKVYFNQKTIIREGNFGSIISRYFFLKWLFSNSLLNSHEIKYKSPTTLYFQNKQLNKGWSLFENVKLLS